MIWIEESTFRSLKWKGLQFQMSVTFVNKVYICEFLDLTRGLQSPLQDGILGDCIKLARSDNDGCPIQLNSMWARSCCFVCVWRLEPGNHWELNWRQGGRGRRGRAWQGRGQRGQQSTPCSAHFSSSCPRFPALNPLYAFKPQNPETAFFCGGASLLGAAAG